ncbi:MAG: hypothetical protein HY720_13220 [Planctomycetes bacterium]|nr:hypothetical protein [Planctomycetota bacterium]
MHAPGTTCSQLARLAVLGGIVLQASGCTIRVARQDVEFALDREADTAEMLLVYRGIEAGDSLDRAVDLARDVLAGRREFGIGALSLHLDLDKEARRADHDPATRRLVESIELVEVEAFVDPEGRLSAFQRFRLRGLAEAIAWANSKTSAAILSNAARGKLEEHTPLLDPRTRALWLGSARRRDPWFDLEGEGLRAEIPMTRESSSRVREVLAEEALGARPGNLEFLAQLLPYLTSLEIGEESVRIVLSPGPDGVFRFRSHLRDEAYNPALLEAVRREGLPIAEGRDPETIGLRKP